jgi:hypothetical protein
VGFNLVFKGLKRPERDIDHPSSFSAHVKERVELYLYSPSVPFMACYRVNFTPFTIDAVDRAQTLAVAV